MTDISYTDAIAAGEAMRRDAPRPVVLGLRELGGPSAG